jgi:hypothetical protein
MPETEVKKENKTEEPPKTWIEDPNSELEQSTFEDIQTGKIDLETLTPGHIQSYQKAIEQAMEPEKEPPPEDKPDDKKPDKEKPVKEEDVKKPESDKKLGETA